MWSSVFADLESPPSYDEDACQSDDWPYQGCKDQGNADKLTVLFFCKNHRETKRKQEEKDVVQYGTQQKSRWI